MELDTDHVNRERATVTMVVYSVASIGETCAIWVVLLGAKNYTDAPILYVTSLRRLVRV